MRALSLAVLLVAAAGCRAPPSVLVTVQDPTGAARTADRLVISSGAGAGPQVRRLEGRALPVTFVFVGVAQSQLELRVAAWRDEARLAEGSARIRLPDSGTAAAQVELLGVCAVDADCDDARFCTGEERCEGGLCAAGAPPCEVGTLACLTARCHEAGRACEIVPLPDLDDQDPCTHDLCGPDGPRHERAEDGAYCAPAVGAGGEGTCQAGVCQPSVCGDGVVDTRRGESCDAGREIPACRRCRTQLRRISLSPSGAQIVGDSRPVAVSPNGRWVVFAVAYADEEVDLGPPQYPPSGSRRETSAIRVDLETGAQVNIGDVFVDAVADDGTVLIVRRSAVDAMLFLAGPPDWVFGARHVAAVDTLWQAALSADGARLVYRHGLNLPTASVDEWTTGEVRRLAGVVGNFALTPSGRYLATPFARHDLHSGEVLEHPETTYRAGAVPRVFVASDGARIAYEGSSAGGPQVVLLRAGEQARAVRQGAVLSAALDAGLVAGSDSGGMFLLHVDTEAYTEIQLSPNGAPLVMRSALLPAHGRYILLGTNADVPELGDDNQAFDVYLLPLPPSGS